MFMSLLRRRPPWYRRCLSSSATASPIPPTVTRIEKIILDGIKATGPIPFATYMQMCLSHPTHGYYMNPENPIFGAKGDFVTSPEISGVFGEILGVWLMAQWLEWSQSKKPIRLIELGPGRGTLMQDILRVASQFGKDQLKSVHLVETSPTLRALQETRLAASAAKYGCTLQWHDSLDQIEPSEEAYTLVVAHEFFDALPFHVIEKSDAGWHEILIALAEDSEVYPRFRYVLSSPSAAASLLGSSTPRFKDLPSGTRLEVSPASFKIMRKIGTLLAAPGGGCGLIVDYGADKAFGQSFRAFKSHAIVDPFHTPGECDLTANVDFAYLKEATAGLVVPTHGPLTQADFLERMGLSMRIEALTRDKAERDAQHIRMAAQRLVDLKGMGGEYQVLGVGGQPREGVVWPFVA
ncbi:protein arginine methyltransferase NDUFAF7 [Favolaschia claudopus]|uniref:Protein arginine methyltransferase NDUFAF7 n=1 Tax=Favolaschia claudopus TaxID=2862362 RepID=A0AAW0AA84_9AGAR